MAELILPSVKITLEDSEKSKFEVLQEMVGGYVEAIQLNNGEVMIVNEDGRNMELLTNQGATDYCIKHGGIITLPIVGNAVIMSNDEWDEIAN